MSETLRDLVVSLSLQTDNFTRNIKSVSKQIQEAESQFKLAAAGVEGFERTTTGLSTQLSTLERRLSLQKDAVTQYQRALEAANNKLSECYDRQNDYAQRLEDAKKAQQSLKEQVGAAAQQVKTFSSTLGESDSATIAAKANLDALKVEYRASVQEVKKLSGQNTALQKTTQNAADAVSQANTNLNSGGREKHGGGDCQVQPIPASGTDELGCCRKIHRRKPCRDHHLWQGDRAGGEQV